MISLLLYALIFLAFFVNSLTAYQIVPYFFAWMIEGIIVLLLFIALASKTKSNDKRIYLFGWQFVVLFLVATLVSLALNETPIRLAMLFLRQTLRFHLLLWVLLMLPIPEKTFLKINKLLVWLFLLQIPTAVVKLFIFGHGERAIGTYAIRVGGNSTVIPMIAAGFIICFHYLYRQRKVSWLLLLGFLVFGIVGDKRAVILLVPMTITFAAWAIIGRRLAAGKVVRVVALSVVFLVTIVYSGVRLLPTLNPDHKVGGRFSLEYAVSYIKNYSVGYSGVRHLSYGRVETTRRIHDHLQQRGAESWLFGMGPGTYTKSSFGQRDKHYMEDQLNMLGVSYGIMSFNFLALQVGYVGVVTWMGFLIYALVVLRRQSLRETDPYWKAFLMGMVTMSFAAFVISLTYNNVFMESDLIAMIYMMLLAFALRHGRRTPVRRVVPFDLTERARVGR
jgi:hypothetical protein